MVKNILKKAVNGAKYYKSLEHQINGNLIILNLFATFCSTQIYNII